MNVVVRSKFISSFRTKFCATRWTLRATCFERVIDNYNALLKLWNDCLETSIESDVRGRIIGCQTQMKMFDFFWIKLDSEDFLPNLCHRQEQMTSFGLLRF